MKWNLHILLVGAMLFAIPAAFSQVGGGKPKGDPRVKQLLDRAELKYMVDDDGDFQLIYDLGNGRTQLVFIYSATWNLANMEIREVWSVGYIKDGAMPPQVAKNLLKENAEVKLGAWELQSVQGSEAGVFRAKIAAEATVRSLVNTLEAVAQTADEKEKELLGSDDL